MLNSAPLLAEALWSGYRIPYINIINNLYFPRKKHGSKKKSFLFKEEFPISPVLKKKKVETLELEFFQRKAPLRFLRGSAPAPRTARSEEQKADCGRSGRRRLRDVWFVGFLAVPGFAFLVIFYF